MSKQQSHMGKASSSGTALKKWFGNWINLLAVVLTAGLLAALLIFSSNGGSDPRSVANRYAKAEIKQDYAAAYNVSTAKKSMTSSEYQKAAKALNSLVSTSDVKYKTVLLSEPVYSDDGSSASVQIYLVSTVASNNTSATLSLVKDGSSWLVEEY